MVADKFGTSPEELRAHASKLDGLGERLQTALDAANQVSLSTEAYGVICSFFVPVVQSVSQPGVDTLKDASGAMGDMAAKVKQTANTYESGDADNAGLFSGWEM